MKAGKYTMSYNKDIKMDEYTYFDNIFSFEGAASVECNDSYCAPWRIDFEKKELFPVLADKVGRFCSGIRLTFSTDAEYVALQLEEIEEPMLLDIFVDEKFNHQIKVKDLSIINLEKLSIGLKSIQIWLPQNQSFKLKKIFVNAGARVSKTYNNLKRWVHYGSSISQSNAASSPSKTWAAMTAQKLNLHLTNHGFSGECVFDPMVALQIRDLPSDYITLKLGINAYKGLQTKRMFAPCVIGFIKIIREKHPNTPLTIISPIFCGPREIEIGECGLSLSDMRTCLEQIVNTFKKYGDNNIYYLDGLEILGSEGKHNLPDELHPNAEAQYTMSDNFIKKVLYKMPGII
jgi:hypothetical protein